MSEHQRAIWTMSFTASSSSYNITTQEMISNSYTTGEQHKELSTSRSRDEADLVKVATKLDSFTPFWMINDCLISSQELLQMRLTMYMTYSQ